MYISRKVGPNKLSLDLISPYEINNDLEVAHPHFGSLSAIPG